ncbi:MAG: hypothetical protein ABI923_01320 [bacterium]
MRGDPIVTEKQIREVKRRHSARLLSQPGVSGVGIEKNEKGEYCLAVHLDADKTNGDKKLPAEIEGVPVKYVRSGPFEKF